MNSILILILGFLLIKSIQSSSNQVLSNVQSNSNQENDKSSIGDKILSTVFGIALSVKTIYDIWNDKK